jgi:MoxR-like ATPase
MGINKRLHDVQVVLGYAKESDYVEEFQENYGDVFNSTLYGMHIAKRNDALSPDDSYICIGWSALGDLSEITSKAELSRRYDETYENKTKNARGQDIGQIWRFIHEAKKGDYVIFGEPAKLHIGKIESDYYYDATENPNRDSDYVNFRKVKWIKTHIDRKMLSQSFHYSLGSAMSFFTLNDYKSAVFAILNGVYTKDDDSLMEEDDFIENEIDYDNCNRLSGGENIIIYGVPGAGKSYTIEKHYKNDNTEMQRLVFHPDYTYSDFVGQILPQSKDGDVTYEFIPGPFTKILKYAYYNPEQKFILVIEEINRGNAPAIFGDVFQLLDREKDGRSSYEIANADIAQVVYRNENHPVYLPSNLSIICTMNTSDQNVFTLDTAFQRRWNMRLIENIFKKETPEEIEFAEHPILDSNIKWEAFCEAINTQILDKNQNMTSSEDKRLGTHFVTIDDLIFDKNEDNSNATDSEKTKAALNNRKFPEKVIKYLWDDAFKFYRDEIFKSNYNSLEKVIREFATQRENNRFTIFKDNIRAAIEEANTRG